MKPNRFDSGFTRRQFLGGSSALLAFAAMGGFSSLLAACGGEDPTDVGAAPGDDFTGQLGVLIGTHMDPIKQLLEQHQATHGVAPNVEEITTPDLRSKLTTSFLAQSSPWDAAFVTAQLGAELSNREWLTNAGSFMDERVRSQPDLLTRGMGAVEFGGETWAVPWTMGSQLLHWNKKTHGAGRVGCRCSARLALHSQFLGHLHRIRQSDDRRAGRCAVLRIHRCLGGQACSVDLGRYAPKCTEGGSWTRSNSRPLTADAGVEALQKLHDLLHVHQAIDPAVTTYTWVFDATPGFFDGTRGMFISWPFVAGVAAIPEAAPGIAGHSAFAPNPAVETSGSVDGSEFFGVPVYAENKDEAWRLLELISSREGQRVVALGGWGSIYSGILNEPDIVEAFPFYPALAKAYEYPVDGGWSEDRPRWTQFLSDEIHEVLAQRKSPRQALDDAASATVEARKQDEA